MLTRVELHGYPEDSQHYRLLHDYMKAAEFYRAIKASNGKTYRLPHAAYHSNVYATAAAATAAAMSAAEKVVTTKGHGVISAGADIYMDGLQEIKTS
jgi:hypothetical protein